MSETELDWTAPGPGTWNLDRSHYATPITPIIAELTERAVETAYRQVFADLGAPAESIVLRFVNGWCYSSMRPLIGGSASSTRQPPTWLIRLVFRLHPELRRREKRAQASINDKVWEAVVDAWPERAEELTQRNLSFQDVDLTVLTDESLADEVTRLRDHVHDSNVEHHVLHASDLGPLGQLVMRCEQWGIEASDALSALVGASPETTEPLRDLARLSRAVDEAGIEPTSLDDVRKVGPEAARLLDEHLRHHGWIVYSGYDLDGRALIERPDVLLKTIRNASTAPAEVDHRAVVDTLRERVPVAEQAEFDSVVNDARRAMYMRDAQGPLTIEWPLGLLRRGLLEIGRRAVDRGRLADAELVVETTLHEATTLLSRNTPTSDELEQRRSRRLAQRDVEPPIFLGDEPVDPPLDALPPGMATTMAITQAAVNALGMGDESTRGEGLTGAGIGNEIWTGVCVVADDATDAIERLEPGQALVTHATSPAFNLVMGLAGAIVTASGGPMSHAAVLAREIGLPAVVGAPDALRVINDGDTIRVDPVAGTVQVL